jgi:hypothetical protein
VSGNGYAQARRSIEAIIASAGLTGQVVVESVESRKKHFFVRVRGIKTGARTLMTTSHGGHSREGKRQTCGKADVVQLRRLIEEIK